MNKPQPRLARPQRWALVLLPLILLGGAGWWLMQPIHVKIVFHPVVGQQPLELHHRVYANPIGNGQFRLRDVQLFISNVAISGGKHAFVERDSYHLIRFDGAAAMAVVIGPVPRFAIDTLTLGIGVDAAANGSLTSRGDLDPNGRMAWNWEVGYKFLLIEGSFTDAQVSKPLVYHVGFSENYKAVSLNLDATWPVLPTTTVHLKVDLGRVFQGAHDIDMAQTPTIKFDRDDARAMADNYATMLSPCTPACTDAE